MKKLFAIMLSMVIVFSLPLAVYADSSTTFIETVEAKVSKMLSAMELQKEDYGLGNVDFATLTLGEELPAYEVLQTGLVEIDDIHYFPIFSGNTWVAIAIITYNSLGEMNIEISRKYADTYTSASTVRNISSVALVFDKTQGYLYNGADYIVTESYATMPDRVTKESISVSAAPTTVTLTPGRNLNVAKLIQSRADGDVASLPVPQIAQPTDYTCWAASIASILNYYGKSLTVAQVCTKAGVNQSTYQSTQQSAAVVSSYGYGYGTDGNDHAFYRNYLTLDQIITEIYLNGAPIFAGFGTQTLGHAVVIKGYVNLGGTPIASYMDPDDGYYKSTSVPTNGYLTISYGGSTHSFLAGFGVYD